MDEHIYIIIAKTLNGEASPDEQRELDAWLAADPKNISSYEDMKLLWQGSDQLFQAPAFNTGAAWNKVSKAINMDAPAVASKPTAKTIMFPIWAKLGLAAAAVLLIGLFIFRPFSGNEMITVVAVNGNEQVTLPDQSKITLRKGSKLRYPEAFNGHERLVALEGEAFFEVTRNEQKPFVIDAQSASVKVLGTSFNVNCNQDAATVVVATGKVQLASQEQAGESVILTPGQKGVLDHNTLSKETINDENYLYWKTGMLNFTNRELSYLVSELGKLHQATVRLDDSMPQERKKQQVTITFHNQSLEEMLTELCLVTQSQWSKEKEVYIIKSL